MTQAPHILTLTAYEEDPECPGLWDDAELTCPFDPPIAGMPCAVHEPCGCDVKLSELWDIDSDRGAGPCPHSETGVHYYIEGEPNRPLPSCWAVHHAEGLSDAAWELDIPLGSYAVIPTSVDGCLQLELVDWESAEDARRKARSREVPA